MPGCKDECNMVPALEQHSLAAEPSRRRDAARTTVSRSFSPVTATGCCHGYKTYKPHVNPETRSTSIRPPRGDCWEIDATRDNGPLGPEAFAQGAGTTTREVDLFPNPEVEESQLQVFDPTASSLAVHAGSCSLFPDLQGWAVAPESAGAGCELTAEIAGNRRPGAARSPLATWLRGEAPPRTY